MVKTYYFIAFLFCMACAPDATQSQNQLAELKTAPFSAVKFEDGGLFVQVDEAWYKWVNMGTLTADYLLDRCKEVYDDKYKKRLSEDIVEFLHHIDVKPAQQESFTLLDAEGNESTQTLAFTKANRNKSKAYFEAHDGKKEEIDFEGQLSVEQMKQDLDQFRSIAERKYSYLHLKGLDIDAIFQEAASRLQSAMSTLEFGIELQRLINRFGDGHSRVAKLSVKGMGTLPFKTANFKGKVIAHEEGKLLDDKHPYLVAVNGIALDKLIAVGQEYLVPDASPQFVARTRVRALDRMGFILDKLQAPNQQLHITLASESGAEIQQTHQLKFPRKPSMMELMKMNEKIQNYTPYETRMLDGQIGYLKIERMTSATHEEIDALMQQFDDTRGLVIDVRGNGGGKRNILLELMPYFISPDKGPIVGNVAAMRTDESQTPVNGFLGNRYLYPASYEKYTAEDRAAITAFQQSFQPAIALDEQRFSDWHYLIIRPHAQKPFYDRPVVVLMDSRCYSATDIFLAAFSQLDNVTTIGSKSGGGSGRVRAYTLGQSHLPVYLSSIMSYQPNGQMYDGVGVSPDIALTPQTLDEVLGKTDPVLEKAVAVIRK